MDIKTVYFFVYSENKELQERFLAILQQQTDLTTFIFPSQKEIYKPYWPSMDVLIERIKAQHIASCFEAIPFAHWVDDVYAKNLYSLWQTIAEQCTPTVCVLLPEQMAGYVTTKRNFCGKELIWDSATLSVGPGDMFFFTFNESIKAHEEEIAFWGEDKKLVG